MNECDCWPDGGTGHDPECPVFRPYCEETVTTPGMMQGMRCRVTKPHMSHEVPLPGGHFRWRT